MSLKPNNILRWRTVKENEICSDGTPTYHAFLGE